MISFVAAIAAGDALARRGIIDDHEIGWLARRAFGNEQRGKSLRDHETLLTTLSYNESPIRQHIFIS
jgi:hypothetical protein